MSLLRSHFFAGALAGLSLAGAYAYGGLIVPLISAVLWLLPSFAPDPRESVALDAMAHRAVTLKASPLTRLKAFVERAMLNRRWSAGGFTLDAELSPA